MLFSQIPIKFNIPFANNAGGGFINPIPQSSQIGVTVGAASLVDGFPPVTFLPVGAGGTPPWGRDFNGLFNQITAWTRWQGAGGQTTFDATFAAAIGGYPQGAFLQSVTPGNAWVSTIDNNTTNPDTTPGAPGWVGVAFITSLQNGVYVSGDDTGSADFYVSAPQPPPAAYVKYQRFQVKITNTNLTTTPTLNIVGVSGLLGAKSIVHHDGTSLAKGELKAGMVAPFVYDGVKFQLDTGGGAGASGGGIVNIQVITSSGNYVPTFGASKALVFATGGGGGGGSQVNSPASVPGGGAGGGAGATAITLVSVSGPIACIVGGGGAGGVQGQLVGPDTGPGSPGGTTSFGSFAVAGGGGGGGGFGLGRAGQGGAPSVGLMLIPGGDGMTTVTDGEPKGGGSSFWGGGGAGSNTVDNGGNGFLGRAYGAGGGGCGTGTSNVSTGGRGAPGVILVLEF